MIFDGMLRNLDNVSGKFLMYPRFSGKETPLFPTMVGPNQVQMGEGGDSLVRSTTTASILEEELDSGNMDKTQTKATSNEPSSQGTSSGNGPRYQDTMRDTSAHTSRNHLVFSMMTNSSSKFTLAVLSYTSSTYHYASSTKLHKQ
nr:hypothetical protein [Tanacetum cinerariifolium]